MKKISKLFMLSFLSLTLSLVGCNSTTTSHENGDIKGNEVTEQETVTSFLVLGEGGLYNGQPGEAVPNLYLENTVRYEAEPGSKLPDAETISHAKGLYFHRWVRVDGHGHETRVNIVPESDYNVYYAVFGVEEAGKEMRVYFKSPDSWKVANIYVWTKSDSALNPWPGTKMSKDDTLGLWYFDYDTTLYSNVIFNNGSIQSEDLLSPRNENADCYVWNNGWYNEDTTELPGGGGEPPIPGEVMRVYLNAPSWTKANIYMWTSAKEEHKAWPGTAMNKDAETGLWYYDYDTTYYSNVIFNNGSVQTPDLSSPTDENADCYHYEYKYWYNDTEVPSKPEVTEGQLYFVPELWASDGAWFAIWAWGGGDQWVTLDEVNSNLYTFTLPAGTTGFLFVRLNPTASTPSWDAKWNQTKDLTPPTGGNNCYTMTTMDSGVWSTYTA